MPDASGAVTLGASEPTEATPEETPAKQRVHTAFTVVKDLDGQVMVVQYEGDDFLLETIPSGDEVLGDCQVVIAEMISQKTAVATVQQQMLYAQKMQEQMQAQQLAQGLDLSKLRG